MKRRKERYQPKPFKEKPFYFVTLPPGMTNKEIVELHPELRDALWITNRELEDWERREREVRRQAAASASLGDKQ